MKVPVIDNRVHDFNAFACLNRDALWQADVLAVRVLGGPGCGKTSLIRATIEHFAPDTRIGVITCDIASHRDAERYSKETQHVVQIDTGESGIVDATHVAEAIACLDLKAIDLLFIENVGTLSLPEIADLGQDVTVTVFSVAGGDDKADKHPDLVCVSDAILLNKIDLLPVVPFNMAAFHSDLKRLKAGVPLIELSALNKSGIEPWAKFLWERMTRGHLDGRLWFG